MTSSNCNYQWSWLCETKYEYGHYNKGKCRGLQFSRARNAEEANRISRRERCERCWNNIKMFCQIISYCPYIILYLLCFRDQRFP